MQVKDTPSKQAFFGLSKWFFSFSRALKSHRLIFSKHVNYTHETLCYVYDIIYVPKFLAYTF